MKTPALLFTLVIFLPAFLAVSVPTTAHAASAGRCDFSATTLGAARRGYAASCSAQRVDCDRLQGVWMCASYRIGSAAPGISSAPAPAVNPQPAAPVSEPSPSPEPPPNPASSPKPVPATPAATRCDFHASTLSKARVGYAESCSLPRKDCDPLNGGWLCASYRLVNGKPADGSAPSVPVAANPAPVNPAPGSPTPTTPSSSNRVVLQAESVNLTDGWAFGTRVSGYNGGGYIEWVGPNLFSRPGSGVLRYSFVIQQGGEYRVKLRSRFNGEDATLKNDVWARVRSGNTVQPSVPSDRWLKVFHNRRNQWTDQLLYDLGEGNRRAYFVRLPAGTHTLELSGRSRGFMIDEVQLVPTGNR